MNWLAVLIFIVNGLASVAGIWKTCDSKSECILLRRCPEMTTLLKSKDSLSINKVFSSLCGVQNSDLKVCCHKFFPNNCGNQVSLQRIYGGRRTSIGEFPWMAAIKYDRPDLKSRESFSCSGSLINEKYILTAAHCVPEAFGITHIRLGEHDFAADPDCDKDVCVDPHLDLTPEEIIVHHEWDPKKLINDIALIRLRQTVNFTDYIQPICLPPHNLNVKRLVGLRRLVVAGWGATERKSQSNVLLKVKLPLLRDEKCRIDMYNNMFTKDIQLCLGGKKLKDTCNGDSGSPVVIPGPEGAPYLQLGIVSYGTSQCGREGIPAVYTSVSQYMKWVRMNMKPW